MPPPTVTGRPPAGALDRAQAAWSAHVGNTDIPRMLGVQMDRALRDLAGDAMVPAVDDRNAEGARNAALDVAMASIDLQLPYRTQEETDRSPLPGLGAPARRRQPSGSKPVPGFLAGDVTTLDWVWPRFAHAVDSAPAGEIESLLAELRAAADEEDVATISELAHALLDAAQSLG